jgi:phosphoribosylformylglycinamidine synthase
MRFTLFVKIKSLVIENNQTAWTSAFAEKEEIVIPLKNGEGAYHV